MSSPTTPPPEPNKKNYKELFKEKLEHFRSNLELNRITNSARGEIRDSISYVLLIVAIIMLFFYPFYGGIIIGVITGLYFSSETLAFFHTSSHLIEAQGIVKSLVAGGCLLSLFICAPAIFIGFFLAIAVRQILFPEKPN